MIVIEHTASYPCDASAVGAALADLAGYPSWQADVLDARPQEGPVGIGTHLVQIRKVMGRRTEVDLTVTEYRAGSQITLQTQPGAKPGVTQSYTVHRDGAESSRVDFRLELDGVPRLAEHLARAQLGKQVPEMFRRLGELLQR